jgi:hypothetical protein
MKKLWPLLVLVAVIVGLLLLSRTKNPPDQQPTGQNATVSEKGFNPPIGSNKSESIPSAATNPLTPNLNTPVDVSSRAASPNEPGSRSETNEPPQLPPLTVLDKARVVIHNYHAAFGENPVGTNPEIAAALQGKNPKQINFFAESGLRLNDKGEIVDGYGTPFFFHQISGQEMEIRSAGPDKVMWTSDDLVTK